MLQTEKRFSTSPRNLRQFAGTALFVFGLFATLRWHRSGFDWLTALWVGLVVGVGLCGLLWPRSIRLVYLACILITVPIGWCLSQVLIAAIFYGVFTPLGFLFRLLGRDVLGLRPRSDASTYWVPWEQPLDVRDYFRQY